MIRKFIYSLLICLGTQLVTAQETVYIETDGQIGRGILKARGSECFIITPAHVVQEVPDNIHVIGSKSIRSEALLERTYSDDLAILRITGGGTQICSEWSEHKQLDEIIEKSIDATLEVKAFNGYNKLIKVLITEKGETHLTVRPFFDDDVITKGYSGSTLFTLLEGEKIILGMLMEVDKDGKGIVLNQNVISNNLNTFFDTKGTSDSQIAAPNNALDLNNAILMLDRAMKLRDGSYQGQVQAIEYLLKNNQSFNNADFKGIALGKAKLENSNFSFCDFQTSELINTSFKNSILTNAIFNYSNFTNADFSVSQSPNTEFSYARGIASDFSSADLANSAFFISDLTSVNFADANLEDAVFAYCDLTNANFKNAILKNTVFLNCILTGAVFIDAKIKNTNVTNSTSKNNVFSNDQQAELKRSSGASYFDIKIYTKDKNAHYRSQYSSYSNSKFTTYRTHWSLDIWDSGLRSKKLVGPLRYYIENPHSGQIIAVSTFETEFWQARGRSRTIIAWLDEFIDKIIKKSNLDPVIIGKGTEHKKFDFLMKESVKKTLPIFPINLNLDAIIVLQKARGIDLSKGTNTQYNITDGWWKDFSLYQCKSEKEKNFERKSSWPKIFPDSSTCDVDTPLRHFEYYKEWVENRASLLRGKSFTIETRHSLNHIETLLNIYEINQFDSLYVFPFTTDGRYSPLEVLSLLLPNFQKQDLSRNRTRENSSQSQFHELNERESNKMIQIRGYGDVMLNFPNLRSQYFLKLDARIQSLVKYNNPSNPFYLTIQYQVKHLENRDNRLIISAEPMQASFILDKKVIWSGNFNTKE